MCYKKPKPDPRIAEQQAKQEADAAAKREEERQAAETAREEEAEKKRQAEASAAQMAEEQKAKDARQAELSASASADEAAKPTAAMMGRRSKRSGSGRRSLLSSFGGGSGYFSRFQ